MNKIGIVSGIIVEVVLVLILMVYTDDIRWFLLYFLVVFYINSAFWGNYLRRMIRVFQTVNDVRFLAIMNKLGISQEELDDIGVQLENNLTAEQKKSLYKDMEDLGLKWTEDTRPIFEDTGIHLPR